MKTLLLIFLLALSLIASEKQNKVREVPAYVVDAKNFGLISSKEAFYVIGSVKYGTMTESFAFAYEEDAKEHVKKHGGSVVDYATYITMDENSTK